MDFQSNIAVPTAKKLKIPSGKPFRFQTACQCRSNMTGKLRFSELSIPSNASDCGLGADVGLKNGSKREVRPHVILENASARRKTPFPEQQNHFRRELNADVILENRSAREIPPHVRLAKLLD
jgi:hypothetical protein